VATEKSTELMDCYRAEEDENSTSETNHSPVFLIYIYDIDDSIRV
jgi:hypothetical protein